MEAAAGVAGLTKVVLALQHQTIPPNLHYESLNPYIDSGRVPFVIPTEPSPWVPRRGVRVAGVSSFGLSGTNVHLLVEESPAVGELPGAPAQDDQPRILPLSAASPSAVRELARLHVAALDDESVSLADYCWSAATGRAALPYRAAVVGTTLAELRQALAAVAEAHQDEISSPRGRQPRIGFVVSDAARASDHQPPAPSGDQRSSAGGGRGRGWAAQLAMVEAWRRLGFEPDVVHGSSGGELLAAVIAGAISLSAARLLAEAADRNDSAALQRAVYAVETAGPRIRWYSEVLGGRVTSRELASSQLWSRLALVGDSGHAPVRSLAQADCDLLLTLGDPAPVIAPVPLLSAGSPDQRRTMLESLGRLFLAGARPDWSGLEAAGSRRRVPVPLTPYERTRVWTSAPSALREPVDGLAPADVPPDDRSVTASSLIREELLAAEPARRFEILASHLEVEVDAALGQETIRHDRDRPLLELGMDSMMALGIRKRLKVDLGVDLSVSALLRDSSIASIATVVLQELDRPATERTGAGGGLNDDLLAELANLPLDEARALLKGDDK